MREERWGGLLLYERNEGGEGGAMVKGGVSRVDVRERTGKEIEAWFDASATNFAAAETNPSHFISSAAPLAPQQTFFFFASAVLCTQKGSWRVVRA